MPIFQDPDSRQFYDLWSDEQQSTADVRRNNSCHWIDYHEVECGPESSDQRNSVSYQRAAENFTPTRLHTQDRDELIHYIKTSESSKWPNPYSVIQPETPSLSIQGLLVPNSVGRCLFFSASSASANRPLSIVRKQQCRSPQTVYLREVFRGEWTRHRERTCARRLPWPQPRARLPGRNRAPSVCATFRRFSGGDPPP